MTEENHVEDDDRPDIKEWCDHPHYVSIELGYNRRVGDEWQTWDLVDRAWRRSQPATIAAIEQDMRR